MASIAKNQRVLDLFSYTGAWGIPAALAGAAEVTCVDASEGALALAGEKQHSIRFRIKCTLCAVMCLNSSSNLVWKPTLWILLYWILPLN